MYDYLTKLGCRLPREASPRVNGTVEHLVELAMQGLNVKDEPHRAPLPNTREARQFLVLVKVPGAG